MSVLVLREAMHITVADSIRGKVEQLINSAGGNVLYNAYVMESTSFFKKLLLSLFNQAILESLLPPSSLPPFLSF